jgi:hypothetical protein
MKERKGYVFELNGKFYARVTLTDQSGKRRNIKRKAETRTAARELLKQILRQLEDEGEKVIKAWQMTFNDLADHYDKHYAIPAKIVGDRKIEGLRDLQSVQFYVQNYRAFFGTRKLRVSRMAI